MTDRISWLVFSKDRPLQLAGLLDSIGRHAPWIREDLTVLWTASTDDFADGYRYLRRGDLNRGPEIIWRQEGWAGPTRSGFELQVLLWLHGHGEHVGFLVDDDLFFRDVEPPPAERIPFCLRFGADGPVPWRQRLGEQGYPLATDGNIYRKADLLPLLNFRFDNPTRFEAQLANQYASYRPELLYAPPEQVLVGVNANRVSLDSGCPTFGGDELAPGRLNRLFLDGWRLDLERMDFSAVADAHWPVEYRYRRAER